MCGISAAHSTISLNAAGSQSARLILHSSEEFIKKSFNKPTITHTNILCATPANIRVLDSFISTEMLERLNAGDVNGALEMIGMQAHTESEIVNLVSVSLNRELEQAKRTLEFKKTLDYSSAVAKEKSIEIAEKKVASLNSRISAIQERIQRATEQTCPICYCDIVSPSVTPCCQQLFCFSCLCESLKRVAACPLCRERITDMKSIQVVGNPENEKNTAPVEQDESQKLNKKEALIQFLKANPTAKVLMFSGYDATFVGLESRLEQEHITYGTVNGSLNRINKLLRDFQGGKYNVLFLNARNMGAGLNIESATHVVLFHRMSSELEKQIIGRAMRLGRKTPLDVIHLVHENEVSNVITHV
jgi:SNF2 family DNA or RNA helicase